MSISKYETLAKVVELGSLTRAADALGCTQSAVSHTINNLEAELGFSVITARAPELSSPPTESA